MDVEEFAKREPPAGRKSVLAPWEIQIKDLKSRGYTLEQIVKFLAENGVTISEPGICNFLTRRAKKAGTKEAIPPPPRTTKTPTPAPPRQQSAAPAPPKDQEPETAPVGSHNPADLNKIISDKPDLAALAKFANNGRKKK
jgi:hypothetical protein